MSTLESQPKSIQSLYGWYVDHQLIVNRQYQRKLVWTQEEKQSLIDSILKKYPVPAILLATREDGKYEIIDGLQRLHAIVSFVENAFPSLDNRYFPVHEFPTAAAANIPSRSSDENDEDIQYLDRQSFTRFLDYSMSLSILRDATTDEVNDVFKRINTYGHRLSDQERRQAGVQDEYSSAVRELACTLRRDESSDSVLLNDMPAISIDLPRSSHGYEIMADNVFWVSQGILRSTDLRDSMDEQCIADIFACTVSGDLISRDKASLDKAYTTGDPLNSRILAALSVRGKEQVIQEIKYCIDQLNRVSDHANKALKKLLFKKPNNNGFPAFYTALVIAFYEVLIGERKKISDLQGLASALNGAAESTDTSRGVGPKDKRRINIDKLKGMLSPYTVESNLQEVYSNPAALDVDSMIQRSSIEMPNFEFKQGALKLYKQREVDEDVFRQVIETICGMANIGPDDSGHILIGVADKSKDADRIKDLDKVSPKIVAQRHIVGVAREAECLGLTTEQYFAMWRDRIRRSELSEYLKSDVLSGLRFNEYYGLGVIIIRVPAQKEVSYVGDRMWVRKADETIDITGNAKEVAGIVGRFARQ